MGFVVLIRIRARVRLRVEIRVRVKITAGGGCLLWFGTTTFALGEPAVRIDWTATYWCPLNCSCTASIFALIVITNFSIILVNLFCEESLD